MKISGKFLKKFAEIKGHFYDNLVRNFGEVYKSTVVVFKEYQKLLKEIVAKFRIVFLKIFRKIM